MATIEVKVPDIGDFKDVAIIEVLVKAGDKVEKEQSLVTVESDKASMEIPSSHAGTVKEMKVGLGDKVNEGSVLLVLEAEDDAGGDDGSKAGNGDDQKKDNDAAKDADKGGDKGGDNGSDMGGDKGSDKGSDKGGDKGGPVEVKVPDIGDFKEVAVIEVLVKPGDKVDKEQSLITVESDKASMEIPSTHAGTVKELRVKLGDKVSEGSVVAVLEGAAGDAAPAPAPAPAPKSESASPSPAPAASTAPASAAMPAHDPTAAKGKLPHASPSVRRFARELGVPLAEVKGSGPKGRITQTDVQAFVKGVMGGSARTAAQGAAPAAGGGLPGLLPWPQVDFTKFGEVERKELPRIKKISGANLHRNWVVIPHVTNHDDADITELEAFRVQLNKENEKSGVKVTMLAFMIKAAVAALKKFPDFNASLDGEHIVYKKYFHIGFAADTPAGLVVPVVKDADKKGILQISQEMAELAKKARDGKLGPADMSGGCFTISSLGGIGGRYFTPIINAPEVAIMGVCRSTTEPRWDGKQFAPRLILPLSLSWDHRVIDGAAAARFNVYFASLLADFRRIAL